MSNKVPDGSLIVCRSATNFLRLGFVRGYQCRFCGAELQVSAVGVDQIAAGGIPVCNPCGLGIKAAAGDRATLQVNPAAREQLEEMKRRRRHV